MVDRAISQLKHQEVMGVVQSGRIGLGWGPAAKRWSKTNIKERQVSEVMRMEEEAYKIKAVENSIGEGGGQPGRQ